MFLQRTMSGSDRVPDYRRPHPTFGHLNEPSANTDDEVKRRIARQKNADKRFNSPFGFHEPKYKKVSLAERYPKTVHGIFISTCLLLFFR